MLTLVSEMKAGLLRRTSILDNVSMHLFCFFKLGGKHLQINCFLFQTWDYDVRWLYYIDFLRKEEFQYDTHYKFHVRWSIPTKCKPIPRATASIFFTFLLSKIKPKVRI